MNFGIVDPSARTVSYVDVDLKTACALAGLDPMRTDHGVLERHEDGGGLAFIVYEFGLYVPPEQQHYCAFGQLLIAGKMVVYTFDEGGVGDRRPIDLAPRWFTSVAEIEAAIAAGEVQRPRIAVDGAILWVWPQPPPDDMAEAMKC